MLLATGLNDPIVKALHWDELFTREIIIWSQTESRISSRPIKMLVCSDGVSKQLHHSLRHFASKLFNQEVEVQWVSLKQHDALDQLSDCQVFYFPGFEAGGGGFDLAHTLFTSREAEHVAAINCVRSRVRANRMAYVGVCGGAICGGMTSDVPVAYNMPQTPCYFNLFSGANVEVHYTTECKIPADAQHIHIASGVGCGIFPSGATAVITKKNNKTGWEPFRQDAQLLTCAILQRIQRAEAAAPQSAQQSVGATTTSISGVPQSAPETAPQSSTSGVPQSLTPLALPVGATSTSGGLEMSDAALRAPYRAFCVLESPRTILWLSDEDAFYEHAIPEHISIFQTPDGHKFLEFNNGGQREWCCCPGPGRLEMSDGALRAPYRAFCPPGSPERILWLSDEDAFYEHCIPNHVGIFESEGHKYLAFSRHPQREWCVSSRPDRRWNSRCVICNAITGIKCDRCRHLVCVPCDDLACEGGSDCAGCDYQCGPRRLNSMD